MKKKNLFIALIGVVLIVTFGCILMLKGILSTSDDNDRAINQESETLLSPQDLLNEFIDANIPSLADQYNEINEGDLTVEKTEIKSGNAIQFNTEDVLAIVDDMPIRGEHLIGVSKSMSSQDISISNEAYQVRLNEAINRYLIYKKSSEMGIELTEQQQMQLAKIWSSKAHGDDVVNPIGEQNSIIHQELIEAESIMLQNNILEARGIASPHVTEDQVLNYYHQNPDQFADVIVNEEGIPDDWQQIALKIRQRLVTSTREAHTVNALELLNELRADSNIHIIASTKM